MIVRRLSVLLALFATTSAFSVVPNHPLITQQHTTGSRTVLFSAPAASTSTDSFIDNELRAYAMKLHTRSQAPKEGQAEEKKNVKPYETTHADYLAFLVDSQHVYQIMEDIVNEKDELSAYRNTGLERVAPLETDIEFMVKEYDLERPAVGKPGSDYATVLQRIAKEGTIPEFVCHYYNYYFAHTAGGRMIGKQMSAKLLNKKTLEFYKVRFLLDRFQTHASHRVRALNEEQTRIYEKQGRD